MSLVGVQDKGAVRHLVLQRPEKRNAFNGQAQETLAASQDFAEGARAFFEQRRPEFVGR